MLLYYKSSGVAKILVPNYWMCRLNDEVAIPLPLEIHGDQLFPYLYSVFAVS